MNLSAIFSVGSGVICVVLGGIFFAKSFAVQKLQSELQRQQTELQAQTQEAQIQQLKLQDQKQIIDRALQLSQQTGPQILNDVGILARDNQNDKLRAILKNYGVQIKDADPSEPAAKPADAPGKP